MGARPGRVPPNDDRPGRSKGGEVVLRLYGAIMTDQSPPSFIPIELQREPGDKPVFAPYKPPAGGWGALHATARALREQSVELKGSRALSSMNQPEGFDCPGCAWPDPQHRSSFEFCENGAKAVTWELTKHRVTREFFAAHTVS